MADLYKNQETEEKVILIGVSIQEEDMEASLDELAELADTAGAIVLGRVIQNREAIHPGTYIGKGKIEEVRLLAEELGADGVICDDELSPAQLRNLEKELDLKVMDRTLVILDIFAKHAVTSEGKLQVEMAQLGYRLARLSGLGKSLSRLGGGIGTRGPGEKKLETDRRLIKSQAQTGTDRDADAPGHSQKTENGKGSAHSGHRGLYERGQIHASECSHRRRYSG